MIASTQIISTEIFEFMASLVFKFLSRKVLLINRKENRSCRLLFSKFHGKLLQNYK